jgi:hypothetical protein
METFAGRLLCLPHASIPNFPLVLTHVPNLSWKTNWHLKVNMAHTKLGMVGNERHQDEYLSTQWY